MWDGSHPEGEAQCREISTMTSYSHDLSPSSEKSPFPPSIFNICIIIHIDPLLSATFTMLWSMGNIVETDSMWLSV